MLESTHFKCRCHLGKKWKNCSLVVMVFFLLLFVFVFFLMLKFNNFHCVSKPAVLFFFSSWKYAGILLFAERTYTTDEVEISVKHAFNHIKPLSNYLKVWYEITSLRRHQSSRCVRRSHRGTDDRPGRLC